MTGPEKDAPTRTLWWIRYGRGTSCVTADGPFRSRQGAESALEYYCDRWRGYYPDATQFWIEETLKSLGRREPSRRWTRETLWKQSWKARARKWRKGNHGKVDQLEVDTDGDHPECIDRDRGVD